MLNAHPHSEDATPDWLESLVTSGGLYAVDLDQRVVRWTESASDVLGPADDALGRRCYEMTAALDPRNASRCRPNCAVITAARHGRAHPDFEVYLPPCAGVERGRVSVMLAPPQQPGRSPLVLHMVQPVEAEPCHDGPGELRAKLHEAVSRVDCDEIHVAVEDGAVLTDRQRDILARLAAGEPPREIARLLGVSAVTVRNHIQAAMDRLGAHSRLEAVLAATNAGLL
ncbi:MAG: LuxR C-terminal-related transcriptional regulator [Dehalococcoidia bacterium]